jgi:hypothetical protein
MSNHPEETDRLGYYWYRLFTPDGWEIGEAAYVSRVSSGESIWTLDGRELRVTAVVPVEEKYSRYTGLLRVEPA